MYIKITISVVVLLLFLFIIMTYLTPRAFTPTSAGAPTPHTVTEPTVLATNLSVPWDVLFLPSGEFLITERTGSVVSILPNGTRNTLTIPNVLSGGGEGGLLGAVLHPNFSTNNFLYLYHTTRNGVSVNNQVVRYRYENNELFDKKIILGGIPGARYHDGGRMAFGPDGMLYITTGDAGIPEDAQNTTSLAGKILRITDTGNIPADNPFNNAVYSYGHRNPQGLAWDTQRRLWSTEHGRSGLQSGMDELNLITKGGNYGWPLVEGDETAKDMIAPVVHSGPDVTWAPGGLTHHNGTLYWGGLRGQALYEARITGTTAELVAAHYHQQYGRIRTTHIGPDNMLYITTSNTDGRATPSETDDVLLRIDPASL